MDSPITHYARQLSSLQRHCPDWGVGSPVLEVDGGLGGVVEQFVDVGQHLGGEPVEDVDGVEALVQLVDRSSTNEGGVEVLVVDGPGDGHVDQLAVELLLGVLLEGGEALEGLGGVVGVEEEVFHHLSGLLRVPSHASLVLRLDAVEVLAGEEAPSQRAPPDQSEVILIVQRQVLHFVRFPDQHVVLTLGADGLVEVQPLADGQGVEDVLGVPVAGGPVEGLALLDDLVEAAADLLHGGAVVVEVGVQNVDVVQLQPGQALVDALPDVLAVGR